MTYVSDAVKRWWVLAVVCTLALSLTSCSKVPKNRAFGYTKCDSGLGAFDIYVIQSSSMANAYELSIIPIQTTGEPLRFTVGQQSTGANKPILSDVTAVQYQEIFGGWLSSGDYQAYNLIAVSGYPYDGSREVMCPLPKVGENWSQQ